MHWHTLVYLWQILLTDLTPSLHPQGSIVEPIERQQCRAIGFVTPPHSSTADHWTGPLIHDLCKPLSPPWSPLQKKDKCQYCRCHVTRRQPFSCRYQRCRRPFSRRWQTLPPATIFSPVLTSPPAISRRCQRHRRRPIYCRYQRYRRPFSRRCRRHRLGENKICTISSRICWNNSKWRNCGETGSWTTYFVTLSL